jgi:hypothetical protein
VPTKLTVKKLLLWYTTVAEIKLNTNCGEKPVIQKLDLAPEFRFHGEASTTEDPLATEAKEPAVGLTAAAGQKVTPVAVARLETFSVAPYN